MEEIRIETVSKSFANKKILDNVSLHVEKGDIYGILGISGAGKSTLLRLVNGLERPEEGKVYFEGQEIASPHQEVSRAMRQKIAMIFQSFNLLSQLNAFENVKLALEITHDPKRNEKAHAALHTVGLSSKEKLYPAELSGGEKQRVAIARALVNHPRVLLSDEATSALDAPNATAILSLLKSLKEELGLTILMVSHQLEALEAICNKVAVLSEGKIVERGTLDEVFLAPKTRIAQELVQAHHLRTRFSPGKGLRLHYNVQKEGNLLADIATDCALVPEILEANISQDKGEGTLLLGLPLDGRESAKLEKYLTLRHIAYREETRL